MSNYAIYQPKGKAAEYAEWACNFYVGCTGKCTYCYLKKGIGAKVLGGSEPRLKKCFRDEKHAIEVFESELSFNIVELQKRGLFFSFTTDPAIKETYGLTVRAIEKCMIYNVPVKILTKSQITDFTLFNWVHLNYHDKYKKLIAIGSTLTGHDDLEPGCSTNAERIQGMKWLHNAGFKTFASIEPIIDFESSYKMIEQTLGFCDLYKVGLMSGKKYDKKEAHEFMVKVMIACSCNHTKVYIKDSLVKAKGLSREILGLHSSYVDCDYNIFKQ